MEKKTFGSILFIGTGGGNDVFSTILAALSLWNQGWRWRRCDIAGVLSPFHEHTGYAVIPGVREISPNSERFIVRKDGKTKIKFIDAAVSKLAQTVDLNIRKTLGLGLKQGTHGLTKSLKQLARNYDYTVLVDVGGDIFYRGKKDPHVLSPMFDAMVLQSFLDSGMPGILFEAGPGTDGELEPEALKSVFAQVEAEAFPIHLSDLLKWEELYEEGIKPIRPGRTVPKTIEAFRSREKTIRLTYKPRAHIGTIKSYTEFEQHISPALCRNFYLIDPRKIENPFAVRCASPLAWFKQTQVRQHRTNCEANLEYFRMSDLWHQFLTPSPLFSEEDQLEIIELGIEDLRKGAVDRVWMFPSDFVHFRKQSGLRVYESGRLLTIGKS